VRTVFKDREKLFPRHIPSVLPHREKQMRMLEALFEDFLSRPGRTYQRIVQIQGPIGSGKTCTAYRFGLRYQQRCRERGISLRYVPVNCKLEAKTRFVLYQTILEKAAPEVATRGRSPEEMLRLLVGYLRDAERYLLLSLDDIDYLIRRMKEEEKEGGVIYDLTRLNEIYLGEYQNVVGVLFIARDPSYRELLDPSERSTLGNIIIRLPRYDAEQLRDILAARVEESFKAGAVEDIVVDYIAELAARKEQEPGDCRFALDVLLAAGLIADADWADGVSLEHVRRALSETYWGITTDDLLSLDDQLIAVLTGAIQALWAERTPYVTIKTVYEYYQMVCEDSGLRPLSYSSVKSMVKDLHFRGIVDYVEGKGVGIAGASLEDLSRFLKSLERGRKLAL
jgi:cell division control protein 6